MFSRGFTYFVVAGLFDIADHLHAIPLSTVLFLVVLILAFLSAVGLKYIIQYVSFRRVLEY